MSDNQEYINRIMNEIKSSNPELSDKIESIRALYESIMQEEHRRYYEMCDDLTNRLRDAEDKITNLKEQSNWV
jgi:chromosome segregation ATPase